MASGGLSPKGWLIVAGVLVVVGIGLFGNNSDDSPGDQSDLPVASSRYRGPSGGNGMIKVDLGNAGPDTLQHTVNSTVTTPKQRTLRNAGRVVDAVSPDEPFTPRS